MPDLGHHEAASYFCRNENKINNEGRQRIHKSFHSGAWRQNKSVVAPVVVGPEVP
jgi:hypothetical protein